MAIERDEPHACVNFTVDIGTGTSEGPESGLMEVVFPEARIQMIEYRNGNEKTNESIKLPGLTHYGNLILKRGAIGSLNWYSWWNETRNGKPDPRTVIVKLLDENHTGMALTWKFYRAQPTNYQYSPLSAVVTGTLIECLELGFDRMEME